MSRSLLMAAMLLCGSAVSTAARQHDWLTAYICMVVFTLILLAGVLQK